MPAAGSRYRSANWLPAGHPPNWARRWCAGGRPSTPIAQIHAERTVLTHKSAAMLSRLAEAGLPAAYDGMTIDL